MLTHSEFEYLENGQMSHTSIVIRNLFFISKEYNVDIIRWWALYCASLEGMNKFSHASLP